MACELILTPEMDSTEHRMGTMDALDSILEYPMIE